MKNISKVIVIITTLLFAASCTDKRPIKFVDGDLRDKILSKSLVSDATYQVKVGSEKLINKAFEGKNLLAINNIDKYKVIEAEAPSRLQFMFEDLYLPAQPNSLNKILLQSDRNGITAFLVVDKTAPLSPVYSQLAEKMEDEDSMLKVPVFYHSIALYGVPVARKNSLEESTNVARLEQIKWEDSSHILLDRVSSKRKTIGLVGNAEKDWERVFSADQVLNKVHKAGDLEKYKISTNLPENQNIVMVGRGDSLVIFEVTNKNSNLLDKADLGLIEEGKESDKVKSCKGIDGLEKVEDCVLVGRYQFKISRVEAARVIVDEGRKGHSVTFYASTDNNDYDLIKIGEKPDVTDLKNDENWDPRNYIKLADLLDKKFYFKRSIQDYPRQLSHMVRGTPSGVYITKFVPEEERLVVKNTDPTLRTNHASDVDTQRLVVFDVEYFRAEDKDASGNDLDVPRLVKTSYNDSSSNVYVKIDWNKNLQINVGSPVSGCFIGTNDKNIQQFDNRLKVKGKRSVLNFTIAGTYKPNYSYAYQCFGEYPGGSIYSNYYYQYDSTFFIKERVSFYEHSKEEDDFPNKDEEYSKSLNLPYQAQKAFGAGVISRTVAKPSSRGGNTFLQDQVEEQYNIHDLRKGKKETWYLVGLPQDYEFKEEVISATREVFEDMNKKFKMAFKGTPLERADGETIFDVKIVGVDTDETVVIGDLDKNVIIYEPRQSSNGWLGVNYRTGNPKSGLYINGHTTVFGGNTVDYLERLVFSHKIRKQNREIVNKIAAEFAKANGIPVEGAESVVPRPGISNPEMSDAPSSALASGLMMGTGLSEVSASSTEPLGIVADLMKSVKLQGKARNSITHFSKMKTNFGLGALKANNIPSRPTKLSEVLKVDQIQRMDPRNIGRGALNVTEILTKALKDGKISEEQYSFSLFQRVYDNFIRKHGVNKVLSHPVLIEKAILQEFLAHPPMALAENQREELTRTLADKAFQTHQILEHSKHETPHCFFEMPELGEEVFEKYSFNEIFKNSYALTLQHELMHNFGLRHQFKGSVDEANFEFPGEKTGSVSSSIMDYTPVHGEAAIWRGMGPYDVHAIRFAYTGMVELDQSMEPGILVQEDGSKQLLIQGDINGERQLIDVSKNNLVSVSDIRSKFLGDYDWNQFSQDLVRNMPLKVKSYEYCDNVDIGMDPLCLMHDIGANGYEVAKNMVNSHWQSYWVSHFENDRQEFGIYKLISNMRYAYWHFFNMRQFADQLQERLFLQGRGRNFQNPRSYDDLVNLELLGASRLVRDYLVSFIKTPEPNFGLSNHPLGETSIENNLTPLIVTLSDPTGARKNEVGFIEGRSSYSSAVNNRRFRYIGNYLEKMAAINVLTMKIGGQGDIRNQDILSTSQFSFLELERFILGQSPLESPIIRTLTEFITEDVSPMIMAGQDRTVPVPLNRGMGQVIVPNGLSVTMMQAAILNLYSNPLNQEFNLSNLFRVYSKRGALPEDILQQTSVVDMAYERDTPFQRRYFADGGKNSYVANNIVNLANSYRVLVDGDTTLTKDLNKYTGFVLDTIKKAAAAAAIPATPSMVPMPAPGGARGPEGLPVAESEEGEAGVEKEETEAAEEVVVEEEVSSETEVEEVATTEPNPAEESTEESTPAAIAPPPVVELTPAQQLMKTELELRLKVLNSIVTELNYEPEQAEAYISPFVPFFSNQLTSIMNQLGEAFEARNQAQFMDGVQAVQSLVDINPIMYVALANHVESLMAQGKAEEMFIGKVPVGLANQLFSKDQVANKFSGLKANLDILNMLYSLIEPSARNQ